MPDPIADFANRPADIWQRGMTVVVGRDAGALQLLHQVELASVHHDEVRSQREDALEIRIEERSHALQVLHLRWILVEAADCDHLRPRADGKEDLRHRRDERDDPLGSSRCLRRREGDQQQ